MAGIPITGASMPGEVSSVTPIWTPAERRRAFEKSMQQDGKALAQLAFCLCGDKTRAEDFAAEAYARTWSKWEEGKVEDLRPYLRRTVVNLCRKSWRRELVARRHRAQIAPVLVEENKSGDFDLIDAVLRLPGSQRAVIVLRYFEEMSEKATAELLGVSTGTVKSRTSRALHALRSAYGETDNA
jgi:RNA polymerase sigma-70 factor (sigma-E family)